ncbi:MAG: hypothetical protein R3E79_03920 [Caldilineaceae bacterium]
MEQNDTLISVVIQLAELGHHDQAISVFQTVELTSLPSDKLDKVALKLAELGHFSQAVSVAQVIEYDVDRNKAIADLVSYASTSQLQDALAIARSITNVYYDGAYKVKALVTLSARFSVEIRAKILQEALDLTLASENSAAYEENLSILAPHLAVPQLQYLLARNFIIGDTSACAEAIDNFSVLLSKLTHPDQAMNIIRTVRNKSHRAKALISLALHLAEFGHFNQAITSVRIIEDRTQHIKALTKLAPCFVEKEREYVVQEALTMLRDGSFKENPIVLLANLAPYFSADHFPEIIPLLSESGIFGYGKEGNYAVVILLLRLAELGYPDQALSIAQTTNWGLDSDPYLGDIALGLAELDWFDQALAITKEMNFTHNRYRYRCSLAIRFAELGHPDRSLITAQIIDDNYDRNTMLATLVFHLTQLGYYSEALAAAQIINDKYYRILALISLAYYFSAEKQALILGKILEATQTFEDSYKHDSVFSIVALHLVELDHLDQALSIALNIKNREFRHHTLATIAFQLTQVGLSDQVVTVTKVIESDSSRIQTIDSLIPFLLYPRNWLLEALKAILVIQDRSARGKTLATLTMAQVISDVSARDRAVTDFLLQKNRSDRSAQISQDIENNFTYAKVLANLIPQLPTTEQMQVLQIIVATVQAIRDSSGHSRDLTNLALQLAELGHSKQALAIAKCIRDNQSQERTLNTLAPYFSITEVREALTISKINKDIQCQGTLAHRLAELGYHQQAVDIILTIESASVRSKALDNLIPQLMKLSSDAMNRLWCQILRTLSNQTRSYLLNDLAVMNKVAYQLGGEAAILEIRQAIHDVSQWWL